MAWDVAPQSLGTEDVGRAGSVQDRIRATLFSAVRPGPLSGSFFRLRSCGPYGSSSAQRERLRLGNERLCHASLTCPLFGLTPEVAIEQGVLGNDFVS
jgi:hypothetical protein